MFFSLTNIDDITDTPFCDRIAECSGMIKNFSVKPHSGGTASVKIISCDASEVLHQVSEFQKRETDAFICSPVGDNKKIMEGRDHTEGGPGIGDLSSLYFLTFYYRDFAVNHESGTKREDIFGS